MDKFENLIADCYAPKSVDDKIVGSVMDRVSFSCLWKKYKYIIYLLLGVSFIFSVMTAYDTHFIALIGLVITDFDVISANPRVFWQVFAESMPWASLIIILLFVSIVTLERQSIRRYLMLRTAWPKNPIKK
jgi:hypothetical protein